MLRQNIMNNGKILVLSSLMIKIKIHTDSFHLSYSCLTYEWRHTLIKSCPVQMCRRSAIEPDRSRSSQIMQYPRRSVRTMAQLSAAAFLYQTLALLPFRLFRVYK